MSKTNKWNRKVVKNTGISAILIGTALTGYSLVNADTQLDLVDSELGIVPVQQDTTTNQLPLQGRGSGGFGGRGGEDHHHQELSEDSFDPNQIITLEPNALGTLEANTAVTPEATAEVDALDTLESTSEVEELDAVESETETDAEVLSDALYVDGQYVGDASRADRWGNMQVVAVIEDGELSQVLIADYPRSTDLSDVISRNAMPTLITEAIGAQSADIDIVSSATDTSRAFIASLDSALEDALVTPVETE